MSEMNNLDFETKSRIAVDESSTNNAKVKSLVLAVLVETQLIVWLT